MDTRGILTWFYAIQNSVVSNKQTAFYSHQHEQSIRWNDPLLSIDWPIFEQPNLSSKVQTAEFLMFREFISNKFLIRIWNRVIKK